MSDEIALIRFAGDAVLSEQIDPSELKLFGEPLGTGAFGAVYRGEYRSRPVAVKVLNAQAGLRTDQVAEFESEILLFKRLRHETIVRFVGGSLVPGIQMLPLHLTFCDIFIYICFFALKKYIGKMAICTEVLHRGSLGRSLRLARLPFVLKLRFLENCAAAIAYLHANHCLYRDLKPDNLLIVSFSLSATVNAKLADFGTACSVRDVSELHHHTANVGTPMYMAPELLANEPYSSAVDVYAMGILMWEMYTQVRQTPHKTKTEIQKETNKKHSYLYSFLFSLILLFLYAFSFFFLSIRVFLSKTKRFGIWQVVFKKEKGRQFIGLCQKSIAMRWKKLGLKIAPKDHQLQLCMIDLFL